MFLFRTSGDTLDSVLSHEKHASRGTPREWDPDEVVLISKNRRDCLTEERQIKAVSKLRRIRNARQVEIDRYWPGNTGRWRYIFDCHGTQKLTSPFDLRDVLSNARRYGPGAQEFIRILPEHEVEIVNFLHERGIRL